MAYLSTGSTSTDTIQSPLNVGIENSRRFRGLPVYTTLVAYGRDGYADMLKRQVQFARAVAIHIFHHAAFELLPQDVFHCEDQIRENIFIIVLFSAKNKTMNNDLVKTINASGEMYVSATVWDGQPACRIAVSNWGVNVDCDLNIVKEVLEYTVSEWSNEMAGS